MENRRVAQVSGLSYGVRARIDSLGLTWIIAHKNYL